MRALFRIQNKLLRFLAFAGLVLVLATYEFGIYNLCKTTRDLDVKSVTTQWLDTKDSGNSTASFQNTQSHIKLQVSLGTKAQWPNAGIAIQFDPDQCIDLEPYQTLEFDVKAQHSTGLTLVALNGQPRPIQRQDNERTLYHFFETSNDWQNHRLKLKDFFIPEWLVVEKHLEKKRHELFWNKACAIAFVASNYTPKNTAEHIEIRQIRFSAFNLWLFIFASAVPVALGIRLLRPSKGETKSASIPIHIEIKTPATASTTTDHFTPNELDRIQNYLASNYQNPDLTTEQIASDLKISARRISEILRQHVNLTPKEYVIQLRIKAASELLKTTELQIQEIAYQCGFNNVPHFNRQFKTSTGFSPGDFRKT